MKGENKNRKRGFTLLEILLVLGILGVIAVFTIGIAHSIRGMTKVNDTKSRMEQIAAKAREFYRGHEELPAPPPPATAPTPPNVFSGEVPVQSNSLNMEQKFRLDAWGQLFQYNMFLADTVTIDGIDIPPSGSGFHTDANTDIVGLIVNGKNVAGVIISGGPDQNIDTVASGAGSNEFDTTNDDIVVPMDVSQEAVEIALQDLKALQAKVKAFDAIYEGMDNDGDGPVDENNCVALDNGTGGFTGVCPPSTGGGNDPNCGTFTLDNLEFGNYTSCPANFGENARDFVCDFYSLADSLRIDPWLTGYLWGCDSSVCTPGFSSSDPQYHKFFSVGPDLTPGTSGSPGDDIIP